MADLNLGHLISRFVNSQTYNRQVPNKAQPAPQPAMPSQPTPVQTTNTTQQNVVIGQMGGGDQSVYVKDMMKLPKNINEFVYMLQRNITLAQLNQRFAQANMRSMSQTQAQILAQLQGLSQNAVIMNENKMLMSQMQSAIRNLTISSTGLINLSDIASLIQANGKDAITKLITTMASSAKLGVQDLSQLKETAKLINASVAAASQNDGAQTMKLLMLLYLPWLPLQEGVGFDLEIEAGSKEDCSDSVLVITITTINFGNIVATLVLESSNSVQVHIECIKEFPKEELLLRIERDEKRYSMSSVVSFETNSKKKTAEHQEKPEAKINMANTNEINPFLLLMAHTIIRHVIEIDKNAGNGIVSHIGE